MPNHTATIELSIEELDLLIDAIEVVGDIDDYLAEFYAEECHSCDNDREKMRRDLHLKLINAERSIPKEAVLRPGQ